MGESSSSNATPKFTFVWNIENFSYNTLRNGECLLSPKFSIDTSYRTEWFLKLSPIGLVNERNISCYLQRSDMDSGPEKVPISCEFFVNKESSQSVATPIVNQIIKRGKFIELCFRNRIRKHVLQNNRTTFPSQDILKLIVRVWNPELFFSVKCEARTRFGLERRCFEWSLNQFCSLEPNSPVSGTIPSTSNQPYPLSFTCTIVEDLEEKLQIDVKNQHDSTVYAICKVTAVDADGNDISLAASGEKCFGGKEAVALPSFITKGKILAMKERFLPNQNLTLRWEIVHSGGIQQSCIENTTFGQCATKNDSTTDTDCMVLYDEGNLRDDMYCLYAENRLCDLILRVDGDTFPVHKTVLAARSNVFSALISRQGSEMTQVLDIPDMESDTMSKLLIFMYSDMVEALDVNTAIKLYEAANKYQMFSLRKQCATFLKGSLSLHNVSEILILADSYQDEELKENVQDFAFQHDEEIIPSLEWKRFVGMKHKIAAETMYRMYSNKLKRKK